MIKQTLRAALFITCVCLMAEQGFAYDPISRGSGVGTGGDIIDSFIAAQRYNLVRTLFTLRQGQGLATLCRCPDEKSTDPGCTYLSSLNDAQRIFCSQFILASLPQLYSLNTKDPVTPLTLTSQPLLFPGPDGQMRPVIAVTDKGPLGPVKMNYDKVKWLWPSQVIAVLGHEFGHKVEFQGIGNFIDDNKPIGPFKAASGGRNLLDAVGAALAWRAYELAFIGGYAGVDDVFSCSIKELVSGVENGTSGRSARLFQNGSLDQYETGIGVLPRDTQCYAVEKGGQSQLFFRAKIHEGAGCRGEGAEEKRWTKLEIWRYFSDTSKAAVLLISHTIPGSNLTCGSETKEPLTLEFETPTAHYLFEAKYLETIRRKHLRENNFPFLSEK